MGLFNKQKSNQRAVKKGATTAKTAKAAGLGILLIVFFLAGIIAAGVYYGRKAWAKHKAKKLAEKEAQEFKTTTTKQPLNPA